ncbi:hypothetical protein [Polaribacter porphyrae]|uniref:Uncharacterized protein n=1 Tax=Polaribacter porphyrae TaxID=1137780 RepID=A0A2S7WRH8_9FLAO|nr:hypothetical protein [Polaribacter porphyrae]PQJ79921.1 hypothetical protein BTO18_12390 [Polaribacter porphyrae]
MRVKIAIFFSLLFVNLIIAPAIVSLVDKNQEISILFDASEEEEKKGEESAKDLEIKLQSSDVASSVIKQEMFRKKNVRFQSKKYNSTYSKINTPPPELKL